MLKINEISLNGKRVIIRTDFNVPLDNGIVVDDYRIRSSIPTIQYCLNAGASVVLMSHLGRPNGVYSSNMSLDPISFILEDFLGEEVLFSDDCISEDSIELSSQMESGEVHLLENLRFHKEEIENNENFAWYLSRHGNVYINDAFGTAHRSHASNVAITKYINDKCCGLLIEKEIEFLFEALKQPTSPIVLLLGGSKVDDKVELIDNLADKVDDILIGGSMAFAFLSAMGKNIGNSIIDKKNIIIAEKLLRKAKKNNINIVLPDDVVCAKELSIHSPWRISTLKDLNPSESGYDIGPETTMKFTDILSNAKTVLWNGPLGVYEIPSYATGTQAIASIIKDITKQGAISIIGGGDTASALRHNNNYNDFTHVSTGGGASLYLLSGKKMPGIAALGTYA